MKTFLKVKFLATLFLLPISTVTVAAQTTPVEERPKVQQGEVPEAVVTIRQTDEATIKEYRVNGVLRAIKFTPSNGMPPYYLLDREGSGEFVRIGPDTGKQIEMPRWIFFTW